MGRHRLATHLGEDSTITTRVDVTSYHKEQWQSGSTTVTTRTTDWMTDGSTDFTETSSTVTTVAYDEDGNQIGSGRTDHRYWSGTTSDGYTYEEAYSSTTNYDANGNKTDDSTTSIVTEISPDGTTKSRTKSTTTKYHPDGSKAETVETDTVDDGETTTSTTTTTVYNEDGEVESEETTEQTCENADQDCTIDTGGDTDIPNPVAVELGPVTAADLARVAARLNSHRTPSRDDYGEIGDLPPGGVVPPGEYDPMVALVNPDGVSTFAAGGPPRFNGASPDYDPHLAEVIETSGVNPPGVDPLSWPGD